MSAECAPFFDGAREESQENILKKKLLLLRVNEFSLRIIFLKKLTPRP